MRRHDGIRRADRCILLRLVPASDPSAAGSDDPRQEVWRDPLSAADGQLHHLRLQQAKVEEAAGRYEHMACGGRAEAEGNMADLPGGLYAAGGQGA